MFADPHCNAAAAAGLRKAGGPCGVILAFAAVLGCVEATTPDTQSARCGGTLEDPGG
ncbi:hypothetical protein ACWGCW_36195 [Streptomyces sp. NPDC054933]